MKNLALLLLAISISSAAVSAPQKDVFTCEKIKDKSTRTQCIEAREGTKKEESERAALQAKAEESAALEKALVAEKKKAADELVNKAKALLVQNLKDPESAKFSNVVIAIGPNRTLVCGSINAKNSYGGYVGAKKFFVLWTDTLEKAPEVYTDGDEVARATLRMNELRRVSTSAGLSAQLQAAQEGDRLMNNVKLEIVRNLKILREQCVGSDDTVVTSVES